MYSFAYNEHIEDLIITDNYVTLSMNLNKKEHIPYISYILKNPDEVSRGINGININTKSITFEESNVTIKLDYDTYVDKLYDALSESGYDEKDFSQFDRDITDNLHKFGIVFVREAQWGKMDMFNKSTIIFHFDNDNKKKLIQFIEFIEYHNYDDDDDNAVISFCNGRFEIIGDNIDVYYNKYELYDGFIFGLLRPFIPSYCKKLMQTRMLTKRGILKSLENIVKI